MHVTGACAAAIFAFCLTNCSKKAPPLTVFTTEDCVPFSMQDEAGKLVGFDIDLMTSVGKKLGRDVQFKAIPFEDILKSVQAKSCDLAIAAVSKTADRAKTVDFSEAYHSSGFVLLLLATTPIQTINDLSDKTVGVRAGTLQESLFKTDDQLQKVRNLFTKSFDQFTTKQMIEKLLSGELAAIVVDADTANYVLAHHNGFKTLPLELGEVEMCIAFPKGSEYTDQVSAALKDMKSSGALQKLKTKWLSPKPVQ